MRTQGWGGRVRPRKLASDLVLLWARVGWARWMRRRRLRLRFNKHGAVHGNHQRQAKPCTTQCSIFISCTLRGQHTLQHAILSKIDRWALGGLALARKPAELAIQEWKDTGSSMQCRTHGYLSCVYDAQSPPKNCTRTEWRFYYFSPEACRKCPANAGGCFDRLKPHTVKKSTKYSIES